MKREDIEKAGVRYIAHSEKDYIPEVSDVKDAFVDGAKWRINSVWRNVNIEPSEKRVLIVIESDGRISQSNFMIGVDNWKDFVEDADIVKWCYKEDLLPNAEE